MKIYALISLLSLTLFYSLYEKRKIIALTEEAQAPILKKLPQLTLNDFDTQKPIEQLSLLKKFENGLFIHFWATWCGPCEVELPEFISFAKKLEEKNVGFLVIAVNDIEKKIKKFMKRFKELPKNMTFSHDKTGEVMAKFGTVRVPETYLFNKKGLHLQKYIGPQNWNHESFVASLLKSTLNR